MLHELLERLGQVVSTDVMTMAMGEVLGTLRLAACAAIVHRLFRPKQTRYEDVAEHEQATNPYGHRTVGSAAE